MKRKKLTLQLMMIRGSIGKQFVIKHYRWGIIQTKFPDMSNIVASAGQRTCRNLFKEAVAYAKKVIADPVLKREWQQRIRRRNGVYNKAIKAYMLNKKAVLKSREAENALKVVFKNQGPLPVNIFKQAALALNSTASLNDRSCQAIKNTLEGRAGSG